MQLYPHLHKHMDDFSSTWLFTVYLSALCLPSPAHLQISSCRWSTCYFPLQVFEWEDAERHDRFLRGWRLLWIFKDRCTHWWMSQSLFAGIRVRCSGQMGHYHRGPPPINQSITHPVSFSRPFLIFLSSPRCRGRQINTLDDICTWLSGGATYCG